MKIWINLNDCFVFFSTKTFLSDVEHFLTFFLYWGKGLCLKIFLFNLLFIAKKQNKP